LPFAAEAWRVRRGFEFLGGIQYGQVLSLSVILSEAKDPASARTVLPVAARSFASLRMTI
jgi:hypothetical protein